MRGTTWYARAAAVAAIAAASVAFGSVLSFGTDGLVGNYDANAGETVAVDVYLYETFDSQTETSILEDEEGLFSAGLIIQRVLLGPNEPAGVFSVDDIAHNPQFDEPNSLVSPIKSVGLPGGIFGSAGLVESRDLLAATGVVAESPSDGVRRVPLGTFTFTVGTILHEVTMLRIADNDVVMDDTVTWALPGFALDPDIQPFEFTITAIPEPCTMSLIFAAMPLLPRRKRQRGAREDGAPCRFG